MHYVAWCWTPIEGIPSVLLFVEMRAIIALLVGMKGPEKVSVVNLISIFLTDFNIESLTTAFQLSSVFSMPPAI